MPLYMLSIISGSRELIGADLLVPLFTMVLINAHVPNMHMVLRVLREYGDYSEQGDVSYLLANLEGSMFFIMDQGHGDAIAAATEPLDGGSPALDRLAMEKLGWWATACCATLGLLLILE